MFDRPKRSLSFRREWTASAHAVASGIDVEGIWGLEVKDRPVAYMPRAFMRDEAKRLVPAMARPITSQGPPTCRRLLSCNRRWNG
jgi:hypothetical protein